MFDQPFLLFCSVGVNLATILDSFVGCGYNQADQIIILMNEKQVKFETTFREMSHELRTPLTSIMGFSELLLEDDSVVGQHREYAQIISDESRKLSEMLNHYLSILLIESENDAT